MSLSHISRPKEILKTNLRKFATAIISSLACVSVLFGTDLYLHHKHGVNLWGYRGPVVGRKQSGEKHVAILGGSTAWGFGLRAGQDFPAQLQRKITAAENEKITVFNLAFNGEGAMQALCAVSYGPVPGEIYAGHRFIDVLIHGWDLAKATDQDTTLPADLVEAAFEVVEPQKDLLAASGMFGSDVKVPEGADRQTQLLAELGRRA